MATTGKYTKANGDSYTGVWKAGDIVSIDGDQQLRLKIELYHSGFDYNNTFKGMLEVTKARRYTIGNMSIIRRDKGFNDANELLEITAISQDSIDLYRTGEILRRKTHTSRRSHRQTGRDAYHRGC